jgi:hypothetical protein
MPRAVKKEPVTKRKKPIKNDNNKYVEQVEKDLKSSVSDICEALSMGSRAVVDVKGKLAELHLKRELESLMDAGKIDKVKPQDKDGKPDFIITYKGKPYKLECKNIRSGEKNTYRKNKSTMAYKVEVQKTHA